MKKVAIWLAALVVALVAAAGASAHARLDPPVALAGQLQLFSLVVPTEKEGVSTTKIVLTVPKGFSIDSFVPSPGWHRRLQQTGSGESAVVQKVTWTGGSVPTGEDSLFQFLAQPGTGTYTFQVEQTYSDGSIVDWTDPESGQDPAPTIEAKSSLGGGGGSSILSIVALALGAVALVLAGAALVTRGGGTAGGRQLA